MKDTDKPAGDIQVNPCRLAFVARFESRAETRYYLNGTYVAPHPEGGVVMVATDGHTMGIGHDPDGHCPKPVIVVTQGTGQLLKPNSGLRDQCRLVLTKVKDRPQTYMAERFAINMQSNIRTGVGHALGMVEAIDGTFPDWTRVVPWQLLQNGAEGFNGTFDGELVAKISHPFDPSHGRSVDLRQNGPGDPAVAILAGAPWFLGIIMPMRSDTRIEPALLALAPKAEPAKKAAPKEPA